MGKTVVGKALAKRLDYGFLDIPEYVMESGLTSGYDMERGTALLEPAKLRRGLERGLDRASDYVLSSHVVVTLREFSTYCIVLRLHPLRLYTRLKRRGYGAGKIAENLEAEFIGSSVLEVQRTLGVRRVGQVDVTGLTVSKCVSKCLRLLEGGRGDEVDWPSKLSWSELDRLLGIMASGRMAGLSKVF